MSAEDPYLPDYSKYTITQLRDALEHVNRERYPNRVVLLEQAIRDYAVSPMGLAEQKRIEDAAAAEAQAERRRIDHVRERHARYSRWAPRIGRFSAFVGGWALVALFTNWWLQPMTGFFIPEPYFARIAIAPFGDFNLFGVLLISRSLYFLVACALLYCGWSYARATHRSDHSLLIVWAVLMLDLVLPGLFFNLQMALNVSVGLTFDTWSLKAELLPAFLCFAMYYANPNVLRNLPQPGMR